MPSIQFLCMVNNLLYGARKNALRIFSMTLLFYVLSGVGFSQNISRYYRSLVQIDGTIYFIMPKGRFIDKPEKGVFVYDITYKSNEDSAKINFSYLSNNIIRIDSVGFLYTNKRILSKTERIQIESKRRSINNRFTAYLEYQVLIDLFNQEYPPTIILSTSEGIIMLDTKKSTWRKQSGIVRKILSIVSFNT